MYWFLLMIYFLVYFLFFYNKNSGSINNTYTFLLFYNSPYLLWIFIKIIYQNPPKLLMIVLSIWALIAFISAVLKLLNINSIMNFNKNKEEKIIDKAKETEQKYRYLKKHDLLFFREITLLNDLLNEMELRDIGREDIDNIENILKNLESFNFKRRLKIWILIIGLKKL